MQREREREMERRLYEAAVEGSVPSLLELLQKDRLILDRVIINCLTETPLHVAATLGHLDFVKEILCQKPELAAELDSQRFSPLHLASAKGYVHIVKELLLVNPEMCYARDQDGRNPLHLAAVKGRVDVLRELLQARPQAAQMKVERAETILHLCVKHNQLEALKLLVVTIGDHDSVNAKDADGFTILHVAVANKQIETINFLLVHTRVEVNALDASRLTAMDILAQGRRGIKDMDIGESLRGAGALRARDMNPTSPQRNGTIRLRGVPLVEHGHSIQDDWLARKRDALMVVASLIATMAFQAGINPPSGVWQDDSTIPSENFQQPHIVGSSVMAYNHPDKYPRFLAYNTTGFIASLSIILLLITGLPFKNRFFMWILTLIMWVAITSMALTYGISVNILKPSEGIDGKGIVTPVCGSTLTLWCGVMALLLLGQSIRLLVILRKKHGRFSWRQIRPSSLV